MEKARKKPERRPVITTQIFENDILIDEHASLFQGWQLCPKCGGEGIVPCIGMSTQSYRQCPVCGGGKLIDILTGIPRTSY